MTIFGQIKGFVKTMIGNPIKSIAISYLIYKLLRNHLKEESFCESIKVLKKGKNYDIIFDTISKLYLVISHDGKITLEFKDEVSAKKAFPESLKMNKLYEKVIM